MSDELGIREGDLVYVPRIDVWGKSAARDLAQTGIDALVARTPESTRIDPQLVAIFRESDVPLVSAESAGIIVKGNMAYADRDRLDETIRSWEEGQKEYEREKKEQLLVDIFREYRTERGKEMKKGG